MCYCEFEAYFLCIGGYVHRVVEELLLGDIEVFFSYCICDTLTLIYICNKCVFSIYFMLQENV